MANLRVFSHPIGSEDEKARQLALGRIEDSIDAFGGQNTIFRKINRYYHSISPSRQRTSANDVALIRTSDGQQEDIFVPMCFALIESAVPHWMFGLFGQRPHQRFLGRTAEDHEKADAVTKMVDYHMERADVFLNAIPIAKSTYKYGTGIGKVGYRYQSRFQTVKQKVKKVTGFDKKTGKAVWGEKTIHDKQPIIEFDGPTLDPVSPYLWHPDPLYWQIHRMRYIGETSWTDIDTLKAINVQYGRLTGKPLYKNLDKIPGITRHKIGTTLQMDSSDDTAEAMGWNSSPMWRGRWRSLKQAEENVDEVILLREYWEDDRLIEVANDEIVIRDSPNPNEDKQKPYVVATCHPIEFSVWGKGYIHPVLGTQEAINSWRNLNLRQGRFNVHNVWGTPEGVDMKVDALEPGKIYQVPFYNDKPALVPLMQGRPLPPESKFVEQMFNMDSQRALSAPDWSSGSVGTGSDSATEARLHGQSAASRLKLQGSIGELSLLVPMGKKFLSRIHQYGKEEMVYRIIGQNGSVEFNQITRQDIAGEFDVEASGSFWYPNMDVLRQQMMQALTIVKGDPVMLEITDIYEIWSELWRMFPGVRSPERFMKPPAEKTWDPGKENIILSAGEEVKVNANEPHQEHMEKHEPGMMKAASTEGNDRAIVAYSKHMEGHAGFLKRAGAQPKPQEQPGMQGKEGNVPNMDKAMPTSAGIESRMAGGVGV